MPALRLVGILNPVVVSKMDLGELTVILAQNGYDRKLFTSMYAQRLQALMTALERGSLNSLPTLVAAGNRSGFEQELQKVFGIGPKVARNAWTLLARNIQP